MLDGTPTIENDGKTLKFRFKNDPGKKDQTATVTIPVTGAANYNDYNIVAALTVTDKDRESPADKVPFTDPGELYASPEDNFAAVTDSGKINSQILDFSKVAESTVDPSGLNMTAISGSKFTTRAKLKDKNAAKASGGVKVKVNKKTLIPKITCKKSGSVTMTMEDDSTYTINFTVEKPTAQKSEKKMSMGGEPVTKTVADLFGTHVDAGKLSIIKQKHAQAAVSDNRLIVNPAEKDSLKVLYEYLDKTYKMSIRIK